MSHDQVINELRERRARREARQRRVEGGWISEELSDAWRAAQAEATNAYELWTELPGRDAYAVYRAAQDRADEAQDALWQQHILSTVAPGYEGWITS
ncbi:MAG TPA: hypothetical protein VF066_13190 [Thermoleophilaceae bacterium]